MNARYRLLTRPGCHLCEEMRRLLDEVLPAFGLGYETVDVDRVPEYRRRFGDVVPVLLRDDLPVAKIRLDRPTLERIVTRRRPPTGGSRVKTHDP